MEVIYEAGFCYDYVMCFIDILVKENGKWHAYEVKGSTKFQKLILLIFITVLYHENSGLEIADISIVHIDNSYVRDGEIDLDQLFYSVSVIDKANHNNYVKNKLMNLHDTLAKDSVPDIDIGEHCNYPYDCNLKGHSSGIYLNTQFLIFLA